MSESGGGGGRFGDACWIGGLQDDVVCVHLCVPFKCSQVSLDPSEPGLVFGEVVFDLGPAHAQHPAELIERELVVENRPYLVEAEAKVAQSQQSMETAELRDPVGPIPGDRIHALRLQ